MEIYSVSQVNGYIKQQMDADPALNALFVQGELCNYKTYPSGHHYFSMKDEGESLRCVMFRREASSLNFRPQNGMQVIAFGRVSVFPRDGQYQLYCSKLTAQGLGDLHLAFEQMKEKLYRQGLFAQEHKKPLPRYPEHIVLITSPVGAAVQDMLRILGARWPLAQITLLPVRVQGEQAAGEIAQAIHWANANLQADLILTGRGGGSMEDLMAFNEEIVARAIYDSEIPVISAVGHEPDVTIADFVADLRAATPSNAAELAVPDQNALYELLDQLGQRLCRAMERQLTARRTLLKQLGSRRVMTGPTVFLQDRRMQLDFYQNRMITGLRQSVGERQRRLSALAAALDAMSPLKVLGRGYAIAQKEDGAVLSRVEQAEPDMKFHLRLTDGSLSCRVERKDENGRKEAEL
ncbi:MAG: exodeoxyribonuclease VII large subunit [Oscillospiraceae bacterium]|nr:exodeoxyribonuclease VII large subunit [Oscillospiraceae bacterium]